MNGLTTLLRAEITQSDIKLLRDFFRERWGEILPPLRALVEAESPSGDEAGSRAAVDLLARAASNLTCVDSVERVEAPGFGQHLIVSAFGRQSASATVLLVGHTDTVHARGSINERPWRIEKGRIYSPGIFDMKANCILALKALQACAETGVVPPHSVTLALTCDEEVGSFGGWPLLQKLARDTEVLGALVLEPPAFGGRVKTGRKGTGIFQLKVEGRAAHAGLEPEKGASAILEIAKQIQQLHALNNSGSGITVNAGVLHGGTRSNVVAAEASAEIDVRFSTAEEAKKIEEVFENLKPFDERTRVTVSGGINRPPLERTEKVVELYTLARSVARALDFDLGEAQVGGASDGNFLAALGIPVLDGMGIDGDGAHAAHEHILLSDIPRRGALLAGLLASI